MLDRCFTDSLRVSVSILLLRHSSDVCTAVGWAIARRLREGQDISRGWYRLSPKDSRDMARRLGAGDFAAPSSRFTLKRSIPIRFPSEKPFLHPTALLAAALNSPPSPPSVRIADTSPTSGLLHARRADPTESNNARANAPLGTLFLHESSSNDVHEQVEEEEESSYDLVDEVVGLSSCCLVDPAPSTTTAAADGGDHGRGA